MVIKKSWWLTSGLFLWGSVHFRFSNRWVGGLRRGRWEWLPKSWLSWIWGRNSKVKIIIKWKGPSPLTLEFLQVQPSDPSPPMQELSINSIYFFLYVFLLLWISATLLMYVWMCIHVTLSVEVGPTGIFCSGKVPPWPPPEYLVIVLRSRLWRMP